MPGTFAIGDIHGGLKALEQLLEKIHLKKDDTLIFLGDYVDGWSQSANLVEYLIELDKKQSCIFIRGNHDACCEAWLGGDIADSDWLLQGGLSTVESYKAFPPIQRTGHLAFFNRLHNYYVDDQRRLFIHAGFSSIYGPDKEQYESNLYWDRTLWEMALFTDRRLGKDSKLFPKQLLLFNEIYIGHTPTLNYDSDVPMHACNVWNIDTGAAFTGRLSCIDINSKQVFQSDVVQQLYRKEKGRNF